MDNYKNYVLIGLFFVMGLFLLAGLILFLKPTIGDQKQTLYIRFANINKVGIGTRVLFAGKPIGEVVSIHEILNARQKQCTDDLGRLYFYELTLKIDSKIQVYTTDEIVLQTAGLLGEKSIAITPKCPPKGVYPTRLTDKHPFYADSLDPLESSFQMLFSIGEKVNSILDGFKTWSDSGAFAHVQKGIDVFTDSMQEVGALSKALHGVIDKIASGRGSLGKFLNDPNLATSISNIVQRLDLLLEDINQHGFLFQLSKKWQREKSCQFREKQQPIIENFEEKNFENEMSNFNESLSRLSIFLNKVLEQSDCPLELKKKLDDLELHIQDLSEKLQQSATHLSKAASS